MRRMGAILALTFTSLGTVGCVESPEGATVAPVVAKDDAFCHEHGVLEAVCTKCNPALIPVFEASGDWCTDHGFPDSFCPICRPERGGKPLADISSDESPPEGLKVRLATPEAVRAAGFTLSEVVESPPKRLVTTTARIVYDASGVAVVNARAPGILADILADVGTSVTRGAPLAVMESAGMGAEQSRLKAAKARREVAERDHHRARTLWDEGIAPEREVLDSLRELEAAQAELTAAHARLRMVGSPSNSGGRYTLKAPLTGVITRRGATQGQLVGADDLLFEIVDPSRMWAEIDIPEKELTKVQITQTVRVRVEPDGEREYEGEITYIAPEVDPRTRTVTARVPLENPEGALRANMFAVAHIEVPRETEAPGVLVPAAAVQRARAADVVFVRLADDLFETRRVQRGAREGDLVSVTGDLQPGEKVVTTGSFLLKTEILEDSIGAGCADDH